jgi:acyl carrier protein
MNELATALREFIRENFLFGDDVAFADDASLVEEGIVDSTGVLELITHIESTYDIEIDDEELVPENLDSISNLANFISAKQPVGA